MALTGQTRAHDGQPAGILQVGGAFMADGGETVPVYVHFARDPDGRWVAEVPEFAGAVGYGDCKDEAEAAALLMAREIAIAETSDNEPDKKGVMYLFQSGVEATYRWRWNRGRLGASLS